MRGYCDNPVTAGSVQYSRKACQMYYECDPDNFQHMWQSVGFCTSSMNPAEDIATTVERADDQYPDDPDARMDYLAA